MTAPDRIRVGFWRPVVTDVVLPRGVRLIDAILERFRSPLPRAHDAVDPMWPNQERVLVLRHLANHGALAGAEYGTSMCRICGRENGNKEYSDGTYVWPEGFAHYIREHAVKPPRAFLDHVRQFSRRPEAKR
jgi:hypothetical protein